MSTRTRLASTTLAALAVVTAALAAAAPSSRPSPPAPGADAWSRAATPHFEVFATGQPKRAAEVLRWLERMRGFFTDYLKLPPAAGRAIRVIVFDGGKRFDDYRPNEASSAFFQTSASGNYMVLRDFNGNAGPIVTHEYTHAALSETGLLLPIWISEGLAEFFSTVTLESRKATIGRAPPERVATLSKAALIPVTELFDVTRASPNYTDPRRVSAFYAQAWALTHMVMVDPKYKERSAELIRRLSQGVDSIRAFEEVYAKTPAEVDKDLRSYVSKGFFRFYWYDYHVAEPDAAVTPEPAPAYEAELALAEVLAAQVGRERDAAAALDALDAEHPGDLRVLETRTEMALRGARNTDTDAMVAAAIAAGSRSPQILIDHARQIQSIDPDRALTLLPPADGLSGPLKFEYFQVIANVEATRMNFAAAAAAAASVARYARTPREVAFAEQLARAVANPPDADVMVEGRLRNVQCRVDGPPVIDVQTSERMLHLLIDDPGKVLVAGKDGPGASLNLDCDAQDAAVRVGYSSAGHPPGIDGRLRFLDFRKAADHG